jgi:hypothetical protein
VYLKLAQQMKTYEDKNFSQWQRKSVSTVSSALKKNVLKVVERKILKGMCHCHIFALTTYNTIFKLKALYRICLLLLLVREITNYFNADFCEKQGG